MKKHKNIITNFYNAYLEQERAKEEQIQESDSHRSEKASDTRRTNESMASAVETKEKDITDKELAKQLNQLAKNKKIDFPWTDNAWKCSKEEKKLATSSAKVFQQLLDQGTLNQMLDECRHRSGQLSKEDAEAW